MKNDNTSNYRFHHRALVFWLAFCLIVAYSVYWFDHYQTQQKTQPKALSDQTHHIIEVRLHNQHYFIKGTINNVPVTFLVDTGATNVSIPESIAKRIGINSLVKGNANTAAGRIQIHPTRIHSLKMGPIELKNIAGHINPNSQSDYVLLGLSALNHLTMIVHDQRLQLKQSK